MAVPPPPPDPAPSADRAGLRRLLRGRRRAFADGLDADARTRALADIEARLLPLLDRAGPIAGYVAQPGEPDILPFLRRARRSGHRVALPMVTGPGVMDFVAWRPDAGMTPGLAGILQPSTGAETLEPAIVLTPLVGFDRGGGRLGQGGGFYDRWFAAHPAAARIGIAWSVQEALPLPVEPWDMPLHAIATEREWITP